MNWSDLKRLREDFWMNSAIHAGWSNCVQRVRNEQQEFAGCFRRAHYRRIGKALPVPGGLQLKQLRVTATQCNQMFVSTLLLNHALT